MKERTKIQLQFSGWQGTPLLWKGKLEGVEQMLISHNKRLSFTLKESNSQYLGHLVELFAFFEFDANESYKLMASNLQINDEERTLGEIDAIIKTNEQRIHLEVAYKFYLYDDTKDSSGLTNWIGPNRKDSLVQKFSKIKRKQFPLVYNYLTQKALKDLNIEPPETQKVNFKGQLFLPYDKKIAVNPLNHYCVKGYYYRPEQIIERVDSKFYIPHKLEWLSEPHTNVDWVDFARFNKKLNELLSDKRSPMCWIKSQKGEIEKCFVVWW